jgi:ketosteroid isomerase-like protein
MDPTATDDSRVAALERRLAALEDERGVIATLHAYGHAIDAGDEERWLDCFAEDGRFSASGENREKMGFDVRGREQLAAFIAAHTRRPEQFHQHLVVEPVIEIDGDRARCTSYFLVLMRHERMPRIRAFGRYEDELVRGADGRWRFRHRHATIDGADATLPRIAFAREGRT